MLRLTAFVFTLSVFVLGNPRTVAAQTAGVPPTVHLDTYTGKPTHAFSFSANGFAASEAVDVYLGDPNALNATPLATYSADGQGSINSQNVTIPSTAAGDYRLVFVGRNSQTQASVGFNVQGFRPWVTLDNYYVAPGRAIGLEGNDFVPGENVLIYLNSLLSDPIAQVTADANGQFRVQNAFTLPTLTGNNQLIFFGQQSQAEVTTTFAAATSN